MLCSPSYFTEVGGKAVTAWADFMVPFIKRMREALRRIDPECFLFIEGSPIELNTAWDDPDPLICNARHWYDVCHAGHARVRSRRLPVAFRRDGVRRGGDCGRVREAAPVACRPISRERMGNPPMLMGEFGIPYDMNDGEAYRTGDYSAQEVALDANYRALDAMLINSTQWNYTVDNSHEHGDQWNEEDLSIWSRDDQRDAARSGFGRLAHCGRSAVRTSSTPPASRRGCRSTQRRRTFELEIESDPAVTAPTVIYAPRLHYPGDVRAEASSGSVIHDTASQTLVWTGHRARRRCA